MFNHEKLAAVIAAYKEYFPEHSFPDPEEVFPVTAKTQ